MTTYTDVFGSATVQPSELAYRAVTLNANTTLYWPENSDSSDVVAGIMEVTPDAAGRVLTMPPANETSSGRDVLFRNLGADTFTVNDDSGSQITTVATGVSKLVYITDNSTSAGTWGVITYGTGTSAADAATLDGYGLKASGAELVSDLTATTTATTSRNITAADRAEILAYSGGTTTWYLGAAVTLTAGFWCGITNAGTGTLTVDADTNGCTIDGQTTKALQPGESMLVFNDGGFAWYSIGYGRSNIFEFTQLAIDVTAGGAISITTAQAANKLWYFYNTAASNVTLTIPAVASIYFCRIDAIGSGKTITITTGSGASTSLTANQSFIIYCDGTNVTQAQTTAAVSSVTLDDGTQGSPSLYFTLDPDTGIYRIGNNQFGITVGGSKVAEFNSSGLVITGSISGTSLIAPASAAPAQTAEGSIVWDSDDDVLTVGTGAARKTLLNTDSTINLGTATVTGTKAQFDTAVSDGNICFDGDAATNLTMSTGKLLGRTTAATGAVEEIGVVGVDLTFSTGSLYFSPYAAFSYRNKLINGDLSVWQRGTSIALNTAGVYTADRWIGFMDTSAAATVSRQTAGLEGFQYCLRLARNSGSALTGAISLYQALETANSYQFQNKLVVLSFYARKGADFSATSSLMTATIFSGTGTDEGAVGVWTGSATVVTETKTLTTGWQRFSITGTVGASATQLRVRIAFTPTGTAATNDYIEVTGMQLEAGSTATPFETRPVGTELALCQRYYYRHSEGNGKSFSIVTYHSATSGRAYEKFPVPMRIAPTALEQDGTAGNYSGYVAGVTTGCSAVPAFHAASTELATTTLTWASGMIAGQAGLFNSNTGGGTYLAWSAEL